jgi:hypothetical protein
VATLTDEELADCGLLSELDDGEAAEVPQAQQPAQQSADGVKVSQAPAVRQSSNQRDEKE